MSRNRLHRKQKKDSIVRVNKDKSMLFGKTNKIDDLLVSYIRKKDSVQFSCLVMSDSSPVWLFILSITNSQSLHKLRPIRLVVPLSHLSLCYSIFHLPLIFPSIRVFSMSQFFTSWHGARVLELQLQHQSFQWIGLISFRMDWLDLLAVQGTLKSLL